MYKKDLEIENPKKFQRHVADVASGVLFNRGYYLSGKYSKFPNLKANGIANIADFHGSLCYVKNHANYNLISRFIGVILVTLSTSYWLYDLIISSFFYMNMINLPAWIGIGIGVFLILFKFGKDICIDISLSGESYRTDTIQNEKSIEYLDVRSNARLTVVASTLDPTKTLSDKDRQKLHEDGNVLTAELTKFLEPFLEKLPDTS